MHRGVKAVTLMGTMNERPPWSKTLLPTPTNRASSGKSGCGDVYFMVLGGFRAFRVMN
ncbi:predicted protein [Sclerotinia sclerotiorum 1980 UF-70]|uniref:Uncharacterized protein n=1 Tax=Sclerotinia sclerotiorum (strain ATCC 18683 / 1980 / Ss-1) TaxID=665079 RepID=A7E834_SCLS1|nr:predicted protein [Sclerotinia sclerotiorum 1980 UF-70]EDN96536.1 predicted protein [Sclerotinia sclerotiorum 1980 UF-70]